MATGQVLHLLKFDHTQKKEKNSANVECSLTVIVVCSVLPEQKRCRIGLALIQLCSWHLDVCVCLNDHDVGWCRWCRTVTPAMHRVQLSCWRPPSGGHIKGIWVDVSSHQQRPDPSIASLTRWVDNAKHPDVLPNEAVWQARTVHSVHMFKPLKIVPGCFPPLGCSMHQWHIVSFCTRSIPVTPRIWRRQLNWKTTSFIKSVAKNVQHSEAYSRVAI